MISAALKERSVGALGHLSQGTASIKPEAASSNSLVLVWSAEWLVEQARRRFDQSGYYPLRLVGCTVENDTLVLTGTVASFYVKQVAQELLRDLFPHPAASRLDNAIEVRDGAPDSPFRGSRGKSDE